MTPSQLDVLDSLVTLGRADINDLVEHTGREMQSVRLIVRALVDLHYAQPAGDRKKEHGKPGRPARMFAPTIGGRQALKAA